MTNLIPLASVLLHRHRTIEAAERPIDVKVAQAAFNGACVAAHAMGVGHTPTHVEMTVLEVVRAADPRPEYRTVNNEAQHAYDRALARTLAAAMVEIESPRMTGNPS